MSNPEWEHLNIKTVHFIMFHCSDYVYKKVHTENSAELNSHLCHHFHCAIKVLFRLHITWKNQAGNKAERRERGESGNDPFQAAIRQPGGCVQRCCNSLTSSPETTPWSRSLCSCQIASMAAKQGFPYFCSKVVQAKEVENTKISQQESDSSYKQPCESILPLLAIMVLSLH